MANNSKCPVCGRFTSEKAIGQYREAIEGRDKLMKDIRANNEALIKENTAWIAKYNKAQARVNELERELRKVSGELLDERHKSIWQRLFGK